jgi:hypothetical protein
MVRKWPEPQAGDILWCRFPADEALQPGPKPRPALLVKVLQSSRGLMALVAYGTSQKTETLYPGELLIPKTNDAAWRLSGLKYPTKFDLGRTVRLPYDSDWFAPPPAHPYGSIPKLGVLHPVYLRQAQMIWDKVRSSH